MVRWCALVSGVAGLVADLFLVLFYITYFGFGVDGYLGTVNDVLVVVQFLPLVPVVLAIGRPKWWTRIGLAAVIAVIVLQVALLAGLPFEIQVGPVSLGIILTLCWAGMVSRSGALPASVSRLGRFLLATLPIAVGAYAVGYAVTAVSGVSWASIAGGLPGMVLWILFPVWTVQLFTSGALAGSPPPAPEPRAPRSAALPVPPP